MLDRRYLLNGDLLDDFLSTIGLDVESEGVGKLSRSGPVNQSPGWKVVEAIRGLYTGSAGLPAGHPLSGCRKFDERERRFLGENAMDLGRDLGWNKERGRYLTLDQAQKCFATQMAATRKLNRFLAEPVPFPDTLQARGFVPRNGLPNVKAIPADELRDFYDKLGAMPRVQREGVF
jgi:hypothetical protein